MKILLLASLIVLALTLPAPAQANDGRDREVITVPGAGLVLVDPQLLYLGPDLGLWYVGFNGTVPTAYNPNTGQFGFLIYGPAVQVPGFVPAGHGGGLVYATTVQTVAQFQGTQPAPAPIHVNLWNPGERAPAGNPGSSSGPAAAPRESSGYDPNDHPGSPTAR